jgi:hypothetical protein
MNIRFDGGRKKRNARRGRKKRGRKFREGEFKVEFNECFLI